MADRETIIETGGGGSGAAMIAGIIFAVVVVLGVLWFLNNNGGSSGTVDVEVPAVSVDVNPDGQSSARRRSSERRRPLPGIALPPTLGANWSPAP